MPMKFGRVADISGRTVDEDFTWGPVVRGDEVGDIFIVTYHEQIFKNSTGTHRYEKTKFTYHAYVRKCGNSKWEDTHNSAHTMDQMLACAIAYKHDGANSRAAQYFLRSIGANGDE